MTLNDWFTKIYCINLPNRTDRWERCKKKFDTIGLEVEKFEAINGNTCLFAAAEPPYPGWTKMSLGGVGCTLSHLVLLKKAKREGYSNILVLEDDIGFCDNFSEKALEFLALMPNDWDVLYFGGSHNGLGRPEHKPTQIGGIYKCNFTLTTHAIATNHTAYDIIIQGASKLNLIIDLVYATHQNILNAYAPLEKLAWQEDGFSDIENKTVSYEHLRAN